MKEFVYSLGPVQQALLATTFTRVRAALGAGSTLGAVAILDMALG